MWSGVQYCHKTNVKSNLDLHTPLYTYFWFTYYFFTYYSKYYILQFDIHTFLNVLKFNIRTLLNVHKFNICTSSMLSKVSISNSSALSKVHILNLSTYLKKKYFLSSFARFLTFCFEQGMLMSGSQHAQTLLRIWDKRSWWRQLHFTVRSNSFSKVWF